MSRNAHQCYVGPSHSTQETITLNSNKNTRENKVKDVFYLPFFKKICSCHHVVFHLVLPIVFRLIKTQSPLLACVHSSSATYDGVEANEIDLIENAHGVFGAEKQDFGYSKTSLK